MFRVFLTIILPLALPTIIYFCWVGLAQPSGKQDQQSDVPLPWLIGIGVVLVAVVLATVTVHFGTAEPGTYVPPRWEDGRVVPGHIDPSHISPGARP
jgi:hypothetical protein